MTASSASAMVPPFSSSVSRPEDVCILRTTSTIWSIDSCGGLMSTSTPSPSTFSSKSVTRAATSTSASSVMLSPVISQSIHTSRSFMRLTLDVAVLLGALIGARSGVAQQPGAADQEEAEDPDDEQADADEGGLPTADPGPGQCDDRDDDG